MKIMVALVVSIAILTGQGSQVIHPRSLTGYELSGPVTVSLLPHKRHIPVVEVLINGLGSYRFGVDTGASSGGRIDPEVAKAVGCDVIGEAHARDGTNGKSADVNIYRAQRIQVGGLTLKGVVLAERPALPPGTSIESRLDGILGFGVFAKLLLTIDYPNNKLTVAEGRLETGPYTFAFSAPHGIPVVDGSLGGTPTSFDIDTGSDGGIVLPISFERTLSMAGPIKQAGTARTAYNENRLEKGTVNGDLKLGLEIIERPEVEFLPLLRAPNIGFQFLHDYRLTIDEAHGLMRLDRSSS